MNKDTANHRAGASDDQIDRNKDPDIVKKFHPLNCQIEHKQENYVRKID
ncbi:hypothetical protein [Bradyrhizobium lablabi]|nr:hypothetical protein [Bradyrhizobium lablabi]